MTLFSLWTRHKRERRLAAGMCMDCGREPPLPGRKICDHCRRLRCIRMRLRRNGDPEPKQIQRHNR